MMQQPWNLDRETAEQMLDGGSPTPETEALARLLAYASGPARPAELSGEDGAVLAFRSVQAAPKRRNWRRWLTFKAIVAILGVLVAGGLAFASGTGIIPSPFRPDAVPSLPADTSPSVSPHPHASPGPEGPNATPAPALPTEALRGLCRAYENKPAHERGKELEKAAFQDLVRAAGGAHRVEDYCASALADEKPDKSHPAKPTPSKPGQATSPPQPQPTKPSQASR